MLRPIDLRPIDLPPIDEKSRARRGAKRLGSAGLSLLLLLSALLAVGGLAAHRLEAQESDLAERLASAYEILPVPDGVVLRPRSAEAGFRALQITDDTLAVDGKVVSDDELRERLGDAAELILEVRDLSGDERRRVLGLRPLGGEGEDEEGMEEPEPAPPSPEPPDEDERVETVQVGDKVSIFGSVHLEPNEVADSVVVVGGTARIEGRVREDVVVVGGPCDILGEVGRDVVVVGGSLHLGPDSEVGRDVQTVGGRLDAEPGAHVGGVRQEVPLLGGGGISIGPGRRGFHFDDDSWRRSFRPVARIWGFVWHLVWIGVLILLACLVVLVAPRALPTLERKVQEEPWKAALTGLLGQVLFFPLLAFTIIILCVSIIGIPLLLLIPFLLLGVLVALFAGYVAVALRLGHLVEGRFGWHLPSRYAVAALGVGLIHIWWALANLFDWGGPVSVFSAMLGIFGLLLFYAAFTVGMGAVILVRFGGRRSPTESEPATLPPLPEPEPEPATEGFEQGEDEETDETDDTDETSR